MKFLIFLLAVIFITPITAVMTYQNHDKIKALIDPPKIEIVSTIHVGDTCGVKKDFFEVVDLETGIRVPVRRGKARLKTFEGNRVQLQISTEYQAVQIDVKPKEAKPDLTLALVCDSDDRLKKTMESIKDNF